MKPSDRSEPGFVAIGVENFADVLLAKNKRLRGRTLSKQLDAHRIEVLFEKVEWEQPLTPSTLSTS